MRIAFNQYPQVIAGISERSDGSMVWWNRKPVDEVVRLNRDRYFEKMGIDPRQVVTGGVAQGTHVAVVGEQGAGEYLLNTDALITNDTNLFLTVTAADCMPVFYYDPTNESIGIAHAGWRGLVEGVLENVILALQRSYDSEPRDLIVMIGPHIKVCHYDVSSEVAARFDAYAIEHRGARLFVKLADEAEIRLRKLGVEQISTDPTCTYCTAADFYSARRDKVEPLQGMLAYIGLRS